MPVANGGRQGAILSLAVTDRESAKSRPVGPPDPHFKLKFIRPRRAAARLVSI
jgi:hypothetical protein